MAYTANPNIPVIPRSQVSLPGTEDFTLFFDSENSNHLTGAKNNSGTIFFYDYETANPGSGMNIIGAINAATNPNYPAADQGDVYRISGAGKIGGANGIVVSVGDLLVCFVTSIAGNQSAVGANWAIVQTNLPLESAGINSVIQTDLTNPNVVSGTSENDAVFGSQNDIDGNYNVVGGSRNTVKGNSNSVEGFLNNFVGAANNNIVNGQQNTIQAGATNNLVNASFSNVDGFNNSLLGGGHLVSIISGNQTDISGNLFGGNTNVIVLNDASPFTPSNANVIGGNGNQITGSNNALIGGNINILAGLNSAIIGGQSHNLTGYMNGIFCGDNNVITANGGAVTIGGNNNTISGTASVIVGGGYQSITNFNSFIGGGARNIISGQRSAILGGGVDNDTPMGNTISADNSVILGGAGRTESIKGFTNVQNLRIDNTNTFNPTTQGQLFVPATLQTDMAGEVTLIGGAGVVLNTNIAANSIILISRRTNGIANGFLSYALNPGVSFTINSDQGTDDGTISYMIVQRNP